ncbi:hypothetical protein MPSEU_000428100 [Mayamaea pseudoterrestris]|nr:hypothetical protein MPSEU_000428100 [Mayamaea pseudoterrestris]
MPRYSIPKPKLGWQRVRQNDCSDQQHQQQAPKKAHVQYHRQADGKVVARVTGVTDSLGRLSDNLQPGLPVGLMAMYGGSGGGGCITQESQRLQEELLAIKAELMGSKKLVEDLRGWIDQREAELARCQAAIKKRNIEVASLSKQVRDYESDTLELKSFIDELKTQLSGESYTAKDFERVHMLEAENSVLKLEIETQKERSTAILNMISDNGLKLADAQKTIEKQQQEIQSLRLENNDRLASNHASHSIVGNAQARSTWDGLQDRHSTRESYAPSLNKVPFNTSNSLKMGLLNLPPSIQRDTRERGATMDESHVSLARSHTSQLVALPSSALSKDNGSRMLQAKAAHGKKIQREKKRRSADEATGPATPNKRLQAELRLLHQSNAEHGITTSLHSTTRRDFSNAAKRRTSPSNSLVEPTDSLAMFSAAPAPFKARNASETKQVVSIEIATSYEDEDSDSDDVSAYTA